MAFSYFPCWEGVSTECHSNKLLVLQKKKKKKSWACLSHSVTVSSALQPQLHTWSDLCLAVVRQMSEPSLACRQQLWSLANTPAKQLASFHLFPNTDLDLFFRVNTMVIYFSGASGEVQRWDAAPVVMLCSVRLVESILWCHHKPQPQQNCCPLSRVCLSSRKITKTPGFAHTYRQLHKSSSWVPGQAGGAKFLLQNCWKTQSLETTDLVASAGKY